MSGGVRDEEEGEEPDEEEDDDGKMLESTQVVERARSRRARTVDSYRVGLEKAVLSVSDNRANPAA